MLQFVGGEKRYCHLYYRHNKYLKTITENYLMSLVHLCSPTDFLAVRNFQGYFDNKSSLDSDQVVYICDCRAVSWDDRCLAILACFSASVAQWSSGGTAGAETCMLGTCNSTSWVSNRAQNTFEVGTMGRSWLSLRK